MVLLYFLLTIPISHLQNTTKYSSSFYLVIHKLSYLIQLWKHYPKLIVHMCAPFSLFIK